MLYIKRVKSNQLVELKRINIHGSLNGFLGTDWKFVCTDSMKTVEEMVKFINSPVMYHEIDERIMNNNQRVRKIRLIMTRKNSTEVHIDIANVEDEDVLLRLKESIQKSILKQTAGIS